MTSNDMTGVVREAARSLGMLDASGKLIKLDSLGILDFVVELEKVSNVPIPADVLTEEVFRTVETVAAMLSEQT